MLQMQILMIVLVIWRDLERLYLLQKFALKYPLMFSHFTTWKLNKIKPQIGLGWAWQYFVHFHILNFQLNFYLKVNCLVTIMEEMQKLWTFKILCFSQLLKPRLMIQYLKRRQSWSKDFLKTRVIDVCFANVWKQRGNCTQVWKISLNECWIFYFLS